LFFVKLPKFLHIEKRPFEEEAYTEEEATKTHDVLNTIRWRKQQEVREWNLFFFSLLLTVSVTGKRTNKATRDLSDGAMARWACSSASFTMT